MVRNFVLALAAALTLAQPVSAQSPEEELAIIEAVQTHLNAYRSDNLESFVSTFSRDAVLEVGTEKASGHAEIRDFYASSFRGGLDHSIRIVDRAMQDGWVILTTSYIYNDGREACCSESYYFVENGRIAQLYVQFPNRPRPR